MKSARFYLDYVQHLLTANTRHGTHSPFVYRLVDEVIYARRQPEESRDRVVRLVARLVDHFRPREVYEPGSGPAPEPLDFVLATGRDAGETADGLRALWPKLHSGSVLLLTDSYRNAKAKLLWQSIKARPEVTVTVDLFRVQLVFFRSGQAREHFRIR